MPDVYRHPWSTPTTVRVVDGVPQCPCHQQPMVEHGDKWRCPLNAKYAATLDKILGRVRAAVPAMEPQLGIAGDGTADGRGVVTQPQPNGGKPTPSTSAE